MKCQVLCYAFTEVSKEEKKAVRMGILTSGKTVSHVDGYHYKHRFLFLEVQQTIGSIKGLCLCW